MDKGGDACEGSNKGNLIRNNKNDINYDSQCQNPKDVGIRLSPNALPI